jgi:hypothetical protein
LSDSCFSSSWLSQRFFHAAGSFYNPLSAGMDFGFKVFGLAQLEQHQQEATGRTSEISHPTSMG